jgi:2-phosphosulfolactate phosphatase
MKIRINSLLKGARRAEGTVVIIDVYRAFTVAALAFARGAAKIILVPDINEALKLREQGLGEICMGEVEGIKPANFDCGNSPYEISRLELQGKTLIQSTRAGTVGVAAAFRAEAIYAASLVNAAATAAALRRLNPRLVTIVAMGWDARQRSDEDELCALYLRNLIEGRQPDRECVRQLVLVGGESQKFGDPAKPQFHPMDRELALQIDSVPLAIKVARADGLLVATPEPA